MSLSSHALFVASSLLASTASAQADFVNWETPHVHPLELSTDGRWLFAVNTPDGRLEAFDVSGAGPVRAFDVPVGVDPVTVRARSATELWVVNHLSDSISIVDLARKRVVATLATDDEPTDVVFAGSPKRAFVSCSQANTVLVFDPTNLALAPTRVPIDGEDPRAMTVSLDGSKVYVAIFESGNRSTVLGGGIDPTLSALAFPPNIVADPAGPYAGQNPPPNFGALFNPPIASGLPTPPPVSLIVKQDAQGRWMDDNGADWTNFVSGPNAAASGRPIGWELTDHDVAVIDAQTLATSYVRGLMNLCMGIATQPQTGEIVVVGTDGTNEVRFEPMVQGRFLRVLSARITDDGVASGTPAATVVDLNPHLDYSQPTILQSQRDLSVGDPRAIAWTKDGAKGFVAGMGSNDLVVVDASGARASSSSPIQVGEGPTGLAVDDARGVVYVLDKFESAISVVSLRSEREVERIPFHDASPVAVRVGRKHLYDTHKNSGLGQIACASCHADARTDHLVWELGDPSGATKATAGQNLGAGIPLIGAGAVPFHPMKGPMSTQTLQDIITHEPLHWRGDRNGIEEFNGAFIGLQGDDNNLSVAEMQEFEDFLASIAIPPNPYRNFDNTLPTSLALPGQHTTGRFGPAGLPLPVGNPQKGLGLYRPPKLLDGGALACATCHTLPTGMGTDMKKPNLFAPFAPITVGPNGEHHSMLVTVDGTTNTVVKVPQLRTAYEKVGCDLTQPSTHFGSGFLHDGSVDSLARFVAEPAFNVASDQEVADLVAFLMCFSGSDLPMGATNKVLEPPGTLSQDTHAAVGKQATVQDGAAVDPTTLGLLNQMLALAQSNRVGLIVDGRVAGVMRGFAFDSVAGRFQADRSGESYTFAELVALAAPKSELTFTVVPKGSETRLGLDRDRDGVFDRDELDQATDPANAASVAATCAKFAPSTPARLIALVRTPIRIELGWIDLATAEDGYRIERAPSGTGAFQTLAVVAADQHTYLDSTGSCDQDFDYRVTAFNCAGSSGFAAVTSKATCGAPDAKFAKLEPPLVIPPRPATSH
ncbi:MAG: hypothetical protein K8S98_08510 [Planctomycetes bacterium]|nr:hypothetical protein [Planctomycetota bacterium]